MMTSPFSNFDHQMMAKAISLAKKGQFTTAPNPNVGCVIVRDGVIVGEGYHYRAGEPHAEVFALRQAGEQAEGSTAYVTLEPCSHFGRTPPCAEALVKAKVSKVICAMQDPNPRVAGRGIELLKEAGIEVEVGLLESDAIALNPAFIKVMRQGKPFVQLKLAASLDGQTALSNGESQWITSAEARRDVQRFRALSGAVLSTSKTVVMDNASLNVRWQSLPDSVKKVYPESELRQPVRVILDKNLKLTKELALYQSSGTIVQVSDSNEGELKVGLDEKGNLSLEGVIEQLHKQYQINHVWVEAGATLASSLIQNHLVDELIIYLAPKLMGADGRGLIQHLGLESMSQVVDLVITDVRMVGPDLRIIARVQQK